MNGGKKVNHYDLIVAGGGPAGVTAALSAARLGCKVLIVEKNGYLGGNMTGALVGPLMSFHVGETQVIRGLGQELINRLIDIGGAVGHVPDSIGYTYTVTPFDVEKTKFVLDQLMEESKVDVLFHSMVVDVNIEGRKIKSVKVHNKGGYTEFESDYFVDSTGDGDVSALSNVPFEFGNPKTNQTQACSIMFKLNNVNIEKIRNDFISNPDQHWWADVEAAKTAKRLSVSGYNEKLKKAIEEGRVSSIRPAVLFFETANENEVVINMSNITDINPLDAFDLSKAEKIGRIHVQEIYNFLKQDIPGFEESTLIDVGSYVGIRESRKIIGKYILTADDMINDTKFEDEVMRYGYPIDIHTNSKSDDSKVEHFKDGVSF